ncbi:MAG: cyclase/dehydrase [Phycisphaerales bacterium]|nr:cyclase/dehydrase [Phycisphaerales bacterium]
MPTLRFESVVNQPIGRVWAAFQDVAGLLPALTPPAQGLIVESADPLPPRVGTTVTSSIKSPIGRQHWTARYIDFVPPHPTVTGIEARFVDEQIKGPFKSWTQSHEFEAASDSTTRCIDVIDYVAPYGLLGALADVLRLRHLIRGTFHERHRRMVAHFATS